MDRKHLATAAVLCALAFTGPALAQGAPSYKVVGHISMPDGGWDYSTFDAAGRMVYTARGPQVQGLNVETLEVTPKLAPAMGSHSPTPLPGGRILITNGGTNTVTIVSAKDGTQLASIPVGKGPDGAIYDPSSKLEFVADHNGGEVEFIDPKTQALAGQAVVGGTLEFLAADGKGHVFVNVTDKNQIAEIDIKTKAVTSYPLDGCQRPSGLAYASSAGVLIAACGNNVAAVIDAATGKTLQTLPTGEGADAVIYDPMRKMAFVPCGRSAELVVISAAAKDKIAVVQTLATMAGARSGAVDPKTGRLYLPAALDVKAAAPGQRRGMVPGTAEMLVVAP
ncbi:MAG TPA: YncE family protein [Caulobacteraceae bacterium]|nr:YncE family protein [Caulobacteraceae bacterium]